MPCAHRHKLFIPLLTLLLGTGTPALADNELLELFDLGDTATEQIVTTTRSPRPISKIAENITIVTSEEIARLNAHTLADVLQTIPGVQMDFQRGPGTFAYFNIQGAINTTVLIMVDSVRQNDFDQNVAAPGLIPVQQIERIEIVKGAASTSWGSALGGVINIVTKDPNPDSKATGMVSGSIGSRFTSDSRGEVSGTSDAFGYYLSAGNLHSDGLTPNTSGHANNVFAKITYDLPTKGKVTLGYSYYDSPMGTDEGILGGTTFMVHDNDTWHSNNGYIKFSQPLAPHLILNANAYTTNRDDHAFWGDFGNGYLNFTNDFSHKESSRGGAAQVIWGDGERNLTAGVEYGHAEAKYQDTMNPDNPDAYDRTWDSWAFYGNGVYSIGSLTLLGGVRMDLTGIAGNNLSGTIGATYRLGDKTTLRAYWAPQGFSLPNLYQKTGTLQKIKTVQAGIETEAVPFVWLKGTWFRNSLTNVSEARYQLTNEKHEGFEVEARTVPFLGLSLSGGYTYLYAYDSDTGVRIQSNSGHAVPPHVVKTVLRYDYNPWGVHGTLTGNYAWWNGSSDYFAVNQGMVWDLHLNWQMLPANELSPELFFSAHNLFNANMTTYYPLYSTPTLWYDGGVRIKF